jgi:hypothetical protein
MSTRENPEHIYHNHPALQPHPQFGKDRFQTNPLERDSRPAFLESHLPGLQWIIYSLIVQDIYRVSEEFDAAVLLNTGPRYGWLKIPSRGWHIRLFFEISSYYYLWVEYKT